MSAHLVHRTTCAVNFYVKWLLPPYRNIIYAENNERAFRRCSNGKRCVCVDVRWEKLLIDLALNLLTRWFILEKLVEKVGGKMEKFFFFCIRNHLKPEAVSLLMGLPK